MTKNETVKKFLCAREKCKRQEVLSHSTESEILESGNLVYVEDDNTGGFMLSESGDIQNLFALNHNGKELVQKAIKNGGRTLDCFDGFLPSYYSQFGFVEIKRESNWNPGQPDVVYMVLELK